MKMLDPRKLGIPHADWREPQLEAIWELLDSPHRFPTLVAPTGFGKTAVAIAVARLHALQELGHRSMILTSTRALQDQYAHYSDPSKLKWKLQDVRGQGWYECIAEPGTTVADGSCHVGVKCDVRDSCHYYAAVDRAKRFPTVTNYSWWLAYNAFSDFPVPNLLILDEAHAAPEELAEFLSTTITPTDTRLAKGEPPTSGWAEWARDVRNRVTEEFDFLREQWRTPEARRKAMKLKDLGRKLAKLAKAQEADWVREPTTKYGTRFDPIWPGPYAEEYLFHGAAKVILVSATVQQKTLDLLAIPRDQSHLEEYPSTFPVSRRPTRIVVGSPSIRLTHHSSESELRLWVIRMDQLISARLDRKGIIHCVSYRHRDFIRANSKHRGLFITHDRGELDWAIKKFKESEAPAVLLSPAADTGYDFPYDECEYSIIAKVPFPDSRAKVLQARAKLDKDYGIYLTALTIMQAAGRGMRAEDDMHEVLIPDYQISWVVGKYRQFFTRWFLDAVTWEQSLPKPLAKLTRADK